jgi:RHS repeat-associated protein
MKAQLTKPTRTPPPNQCAPVTFSTTGGYPNTMKVYMNTATNGATIFYTVGTSDYVTPTHNGSTPTGATHVYTGPVNVAVNAEKFFEAVAYKSGMTDSAFTEFDADNTGGGGQAPIRLSGASSSSPRTVTYNLDKAGNRTGPNGVVDTGVATSYTPNNLNQYTGVGGTNNVGNGSEHELNSYQGINYTYVNDERLASVISSTNNYQLLHDALGRCVKRTLNNITTYYVYDGEKPILEYNSSGAITGRNLYGKAIDEILMRIDATYGTYYYQDDHEGSVTHLISSSGGLLARYRYDVFGAPSIEDGNGSGLPPSAFNNRFMFTGREYAANFGIYEYRARAYHPGLGRFMSEDPKGFVHRMGVGKEPDKWDFFAHPDEGELNLFRYCDNDPLDFTDPMGLDLTLVGQDGNPLTADQLAYAQQQYAIGKTQAITNRNGSINQAAADKFRAVEGSDTVHVKMKMTNEKYNAKEFSVQKNKDGSYNFNVKWNPHLARVNHNDSRNSPGAILLHEVFHAADLLRNGSEFIHAEQGGTRAGMPSKSGSPAEIRALNFEQSVYPQLNHEGVRDDLGFKGWIPVGAPNEGGQE